MSPWRSRARGLVAESPLGIVGTGSPNGPVSDPLTEGAAPAGGAPRRFVVPSGHRGPDGTRLEEIVELRHRARESAFLLGVDRASVFLFGPPGSPTCQIVTFVRTTRHFERPQVHPPDLAREARTLLDSVSRIEVADLRENAPPPGAMRDYLQGVGVCGLLVLPLRREQGIVGFISLEVTSEPRSWSERDRERMRKLVGQIEEALTPSLLSSVRRAGQEGPPSPVPSQMPDGGPGDQTMEDAGDPVPEEPGPASPDPGAGEDPWAHHPQSRETAEELPPETLEEVSGVSGGAPRAFDTRLPRLRALEGAAVVGADVGDELLHLSEIQDGTLLLLDDQVSEDPDARELVSDLRELSVRLRRGIESFGQMTKDGMVSGEVVDLNRSLAAMVHRLASLVGQGPRFVVCPSVDPLPVRANPFLLQRALEHLILNSRTAVAPGGTIRVSWRRATVSPRDSTSTYAGKLESDLAVARIRVEDDGPGIDPEHLPWVFEPYFSVLRQGGTGRGLGLTTVQAIVEGHGGWVNLHSQPGDGTIVTLHLPLANVGSDQAGDARQNLEAPAATEPLILLLEDEPLLSRLMERILVRAGYRVEKARNLAEAGDLWNRFGDQADLVIVERYLPGGEDALSLVRGWVGEREELLLVLLDRKAGPADSPPEGIGAGAYFSRPFDPSDVARQVARQLSRREREEHRGSSESRETELEGPAH